MKETKNTYRPAPQLLNAVEASVRLGLSPKTLANWRSSGGGPRFVKIGAGVVRYPVAEIDAWVERHLLENTSQQTAA